MKFWMFVRRHYAENGTKLLGVAQGIVASLAGIGGLIPEGHLKYWLAASAILTVLRGYGNTRRAES